MVTAEQRITRARRLLRGVEDAVIEGDFESAAAFAAALIDMAVLAAAEQREGYLQVLAIADELADVKGFPFEH